MKSDAERITELEHRVAMLENQLRLAMDLIGQRLNPSPVSSSSFGASPSFPAQPHPSSQEVPGEILALMRENRKIEAIKRYREIYGVGLAEAKNAVEALPLR
ncbi:MAG: ribosomal protein L7/L12 [Myxococcota bacterium]